jgi:hypothetical protein
VHADVAERAYGAASLTSIKVFENGVLISSRAREEINVVADAASLILL